MFRRTLFVAFLAAMTSRGETEYLERLGGDDDVLVRYSVLSRDGVNLLLGKIYNRSRYPLRCMVAANDLKREIRFNPGDAKDIEGGVSLPYFHWDIQCSVPLRYKFAVTTVGKPFPGGLVAATAGDLGIQFQVENLGTAPMEFNWPAVSFVGTDQSRHDIARLNLDADVLCCERQPLAPVTIPPHANLSSGVIPAVNMRGEYPHPILAGELALDRVEQFIESAKGGQRIGLYIDLLASGRRIPITLEFRVTGAEPVLWTQGH
jgi:hypothetical protein